MVFQKKSNIWPGFVKDNIIHQEMRDLWEVFEGEKSLEDFRFYHETRGLSMKLNMCCLLIK